MGLVHRERITLYYEEAGEGKPPFVLVHGWCCNHTYFAPQFEHLSSSKRTASPGLIEEVRGLDYREVQRQYVANSLHPDRQ